MSAPRISASRKVVLAYGNCPISASGSLVSCQDDTMKRPPQTSIAVTPHSVVCWIDAKQIPAIGHDDEYVLVWLDTTRPTIPVATCPIALGYQDGEQWFYAGTTEEILSPVTHWAPLPAGPSVKTPDPRPCIHRIGQTTCGYPADAPMHRGANGPPPPAGRHEYAAALEWRGVPKGATIEEVTPPSHRKAQGRPSNVQQCNCAGDKTRVGNKRCTVLVAVGSGGLCPYCRQMFPCDHCTRAREKGNK